MRTIRNMEDCTNTTVLADEEAVKMPKQQRTLDAFFKSPKSLAKSEPTNACNFTGKQKQNITSRANNLKSFQDGAKLKCGKSCGAKKNMINSDSEEGILCGSSLLSTESANKMEEISYPDFLKQSDNDVDKGAAIEEELHVEHSPKAIDQSYSITSDDSFQQKHACDLGEALDMLENSVEDSTMTELPKQNAEHYLETTNVKKLAHQDTAVKVTENTETILSNGHVIGDRENNIEENIIEAVENTRAQELKGFVTSRWKLQQRKIKENEDTEQVNMTDMSGAEEVCADQYHEGEESNINCKTCAKKVFVSKSKPENDKQKQEMDAESEINQVHVKWEEDDNGPDTLPSKAPTGCVPITSFFTSKPKKSAKLQLLKEENDGEVIVIVDIHPEPCSLTEGPKQTKISGNLSKKVPATSTSKALNKSAKKSATPVYNAVAEDIDLSITHIESTFITMEDEEVTKNGLRVKKGTVVDGNESSGVKQGVKKGSTPDTCSTVSEVQEKHTELVSKKTNFLTKTNDKTNVEEKENDESTKTLCMEVEITKEEKMTDTGQTGSRTATLMSHFAQLDSIRITPKKTAQSTLNFGGKPVAKQDSKLMKKTTSRVKKEKNAEDNMESDDDVFNSPPPKKQITVGAGESLNVTPKRKGNHNSQKFKTPPNEEVKTPRGNTRGLKENEDRAVCDKTESISPRKKRLLSSVYKTTLLHPTRGKKRTPLKLKFTRLGDKEVGGEEVCSPKSKAKKQLGMDKAQKLLNKAKHKRKTTIESEVARVPSNSTERKAKGKMKIEDSPPINLRRSSRSSSLTASKIIGLCYEDQKNERTKTSVEKADAPSSQLNKQVKIPKKDKSPRKSPKRSAKSTQKGTKLASIFMKPGKQLGTLAQPISISDDSFKQGVLTEEEKDGQRIRREFLLSGVPQALRKQLSCQEAVVLSEYAPFPSDNHVTQEPAASHSEASDGNPWKLPDHCLAAVKLRPDDWWIKQSLQHFQTSSVGTTGSIGLFKQFLKTAQSSAQTSNPASTLKDEVVRLLLAEIATHNPSFPVRRMYRQLCARKKEAEQQEITMPITEEPSVEVEICKPQKLSKKRKQSADERRTRNKRRRETSVDDVLNTTDVMEEGQNPIQDTKMENSGATIKEASDCCHTLLWTDKYSPTSSAQILGNIGTMKKVKSWLVEWKHRTDIEMKKLQKEQLKQAKKEGKTKEEIKQLGVDWWTSDESDFDMSDSEDTTDTEAEDTMCNTTLVTGPHGAGKTSMVYGLAQELGYKVFEVNASCRRNGKHILAQLQEATQSHQVSKSKLDDLYKSLMCEGKDTGAKPTLKHLPEEKKPTSVTGFFKKAPSTGVQDTGCVQAEVKCRRGRPQRRKAQNPEEKPKKKSTGRKTENVETEDQSCADRKKGLKLSSVSLILFDEVDLVFEDDKGFWTAIQTFMATTKRPILLTATDGNFLEKFKCRVEHHAIKAPSLLNTTSYLQLICLSENLRTDFSDMRTLASLQGCDMRTLLLTLHWCAGSGGSTKPTARPIKYRQSCLKEKSEMKNFVMTPMKSAFSAIHCDSQSADEFEIQKPKKRARRCIIEDDASRESLLLQSPVKSSEFHSPAKSSRSLPNFLHDDGSSQGMPSLGSSQEAVSDVCSTDDYMEIPLDEDTPAVHTLLYAGTSGLSALLPHGASCLLKVFNDDTASNEDRISIHSHFLASGVDIIYSNLQQLLPLDKFKVSYAIPRRVITDTPTKAIKRPTRILHMADLYDSEASNDGFLTLSQSTRHQDLGKTSMTATENTTSNGISNKAAPTSRSSCVSNLVQKSLDHMAELYSDISLIDTFQNKPVHESSICSRNRFQFDQYKGKLTAGLSDKSCNYMYDESTREQHNLSDIMSRLAVGSFSRTKSELEEVRAECDALDDENRDEARRLLRIPVEDLTETLRIDPEDIRQKAMAQCVCRAADGVANILPFSTSIQCIAMATDYIPTIRAMCKMEQLRCVVQNKRRFFHHLEPMVNQMRKSTMDTLCMTFH